MTLQLCVLLWSSDGQEEALTDYENRVLALVPEHGGEVVSRVRRLGEGDGPLEVQLIHFPDESAVSAYMEDPDRLALADVHRRAVAKTEVWRVETIV